MPDLAGRGPIGQKTGKPSPKPPKPVRRRNPDTAAQSKLELDQGAGDYMMWCKGQLCAACGLRPAKDFHHGEDAKMPRCHWRGCGLCGDCHMLHHNRKAEFKATYGHDDILAGLHAQMYLRATGVDPRTFWARSKLPNERAGHTF